MELTNNNSLSASTSSRPTVPPKPKSQPAEVPQPKTTVGTQVNLRRKTSPNIRNEDSNFDKAFETPKKFGASNNNLSNTTNSLHASPKSISAKPALPPKPVTGSITSPKKSVSSNTSPISPSIPSLRENVVVKLPLFESNSPASVATTNCPNNRTSPHTSPLHERLRGVKQSVRSPPTPLKPLSTRPSISSYAQAKPLAFQYPPSSFLSANQRAESSKKSASLGRNFDIVGFSKDLKKSSTPMSRVGPLDLSSSTSQPVSLPPSFGRAISFAPENTSQTQPPTPPARKKRPSLSSPDPTPTSEQPSPFPTATPQSTPVYAKVDMEKKWECRRTKNNSGLDSNETESREITNISEFGEKGLPAGYTGVEGNNSSWLSKYLDTTGADADDERANGETTTNLFSSVGREVANEIPNRDSSIVMGGNVRNSSADKNLTENDSFLFQHTEQGHGQEMINDNNSNVARKEPEIMERKQEKMSPVDENKHSDFESEFEYKLETLPNIQLIGSSDGNSANQLLTTKHIISNNMKSEEKTTKDATVVSRIIFHKFEKSASKEGHIGIQDESDNTALASPIWHPNTNVLAPRRRSSDSSSASSDSPSTTSSSTRDRCSISTSRSHDSSWVDEGEISTGALGDLDSDAPNPNDGRRRKVISLHASFGKGGGDESSSSTNGNGPTRQTGRKGKPMLADALASKFKMQTGKKVLSDAGINKSRVPVQIGEAPHKTQSLPGFEFQGDGQSLDESVISTDNSTNRTTTNSAAGSDTTIEGNEGTVVAEDMHDDILVELPPKEQEIFKAAREILTSERTFVDILVLLTVDFPQALKEASIHPLISDSDMKRILGPLPQLLPFNQMLLSDLEERIASWRTQRKVSDIFVKKGPFLKHYSEYMRDFKILGEHFDELRKKYPKFDKTVSDFECSSRCKKLSIRQNMLVPVQRMPKYVLLLERYLKHLDEECGDYEDTLKALKIVRDVADHANEAIRLKENGDQMKKLQERLVDNKEILKADRQIIKEGHLVKVSRKENQPRYFALMTDCLFYMSYHTSTGSRKDLKLQCELPLAGMMVLEEAGDDKTNEFSVISTTRSFNLVARTEKERDEWIRALNNAIYANMKKRACSTPDMEKEFEIGKVAPVWVQDTRVTMCQLCTAEFTLTFRRHHCRACGKVVCSHCSGNEAPLQYQNFKAARVCDNCYPHLLEEFDKEVRINMDNVEKTKDLEDIRNRFKKTTPNVSNRYRHKKSIPQRMEVNSANGAQIQMSGYLHWREKKSWKRRWFVLSERVLYVCMASEDVVAYKTIPILGYEVEVITEKTYEGVDGRLVFRLTHSGQNPMIFQADSPSSVDKWVGVMREATVLS